MRRQSMCQVVRDTKGRVTKIMGHRGAIPAHISSLRIPPAWVNVTVNPDPNAKLYVLGTDAAGRSQRLYSSMHSEKASAMKFKRVRRLLQCRDTIKRSIETDCQIAVNDEASWADYYRKDAAVVAYLIFETGIRPGSGGDTRGAVKAFGACTLQARHVKVMASGNVWLDFTGKKGVQIKLRITNPFLARELVKRKRQCNGHYTMELFDITYSRLNKYISEITGGEFCPKDLRTMVANMLCRELVDKVKRVPASATARKRLERDIMGQVAAALGNTAAVCRKAYVDPIVMRRLAVN